MKLATVVLIAALAATSPLSAEEAAPDTLGLESWFVTSDLNITLTQSAYSENWGGSEVGALTWALNSNSLASRQLTSRIHNKNTLLLGFGQTHSQSRETKDWAKPKESTDLIDFESLFRFTYDWFVDPYLAGRIETHFTDDSNPKETRYLDPTLFSESAGIAKVLLKEERREWTARLGGAIRQHVDRDVFDADTSTSETVSTQDGGLEFVTDFRSPLLDEQIMFTSRLAAYKALYFSEEDELAGLEGEDDWKAVDIDWDNLFSAKITEYLVVNLYFQALYDRQIVDEVRIREALALGFTFGIR